MVKMPHWPIPYSSLDNTQGPMRMRDLLNAVGNPQRRLPPVIHVTGTNGKGSVLAYLKSIFEHSGYIAHRYTSPHLVQFNERINLQGSDIDDRFLAECVEECRFATKDLPLTFFEGITTIAFLAFSRKPADVLLLEVGAGARLDATNSIENSLQSIIMPISFDHEQLLGDSLAKIAYEKSFVAKKGSECIISWQPDEIVDLIANECRNHGATTISCRKEWDFIVQETNFSLNIAEDIIEFPLPSLRGVHQIVNAATAAVAAFFLKKSFPKITINTIRLGLRKAVWPARMQHITRGMLYEMLPEEAELWLDGAHNPSGAQMMAASMLQLKPEKPLYIINGRTRDHDIVGFLQYFTKITKMVCGIRVVNEPLAEKAENIVAGAEALGMRAKQCSSLKDALESCLYDNNYKPCRILVLGSLYLAGDMLEANKGA